MVSESESNFQRSLEAKTNEARQAVGDCISKFLSTELPMRDAAIRKAHASVELLLSVLASNDQPTWLVSLRDNLHCVRDFSNKPQAVEAMKNVINAFPALNSHKWRLRSASSTEGVDFDAIFAKHKAEKKIPELFDGVISILRQILDSDQIESLSLRKIREIERVVSTLEKAKNGSFLAAQGAWVFVRTWFINSSQELLGEIPIAGPIFRGLKKTIEDLDSGMVQVNIDVTHEVTFALKDTVPTLGYTANSLRELPEVKCLPSPDDSESA